ncbi:MAG TPA: sugar phosphate nucleotidyltransferase [Candidatus Acidoferrales bacterium]|nr:sugar phosphate nucleotidyltransferase [Candidatus Acidoferrales bacterium]
MYVVILAGGGGTRLWPLSRQDRPKPFLPLVGSETLFQRTVARVLPLVGPDEIYVVAERRHARHALEQVPSLPVEHVLGEPMGRNTAAAVALAALAVERPLGETMVVLPADAWISDDGAFRAALRAVAGTDGLAAGALGVEAPLVTLGVRPDRPETGYGYLVPRVDAAAGPGRATVPVAAASPDAGAAPGAFAAYPLEAFVEKPAANRAAELLRMPGVAWNAGMFAWRRRAILGALERFAPDVLDGVRLALTAPGASDQGGPLDGPEAARRYATVRSVSIDYAVMEDAARAGIVLMGSLDAGWSDVGNWRAVRDLGAALPGEAPGMVIDVGSRDVLVRAVGGRLVATIGLSDTIVIDTPDALLVCAADRAQDVKVIVERLRDAGEMEHL